MIPTRVWHLEMARAEQLVAARDPGRDVQARRVEIPSGKLSRFFYREVGRDHHWVDRLSWPADRWQAWAEQVQTWVIHERATPAGYAELEQRPGGVVNLAYFGILPAFQGRGLGGWLLSVVVADAWERGAARFTLDTCELDGPHALRNYQHRGFRVVRATVEPRRRAA